MSRAMTGSTSRAAVLAVDSGGSGTRVRHDSLAEVVELPGVAWSSGDVPGGLARTVADAWGRLGRPATAVVVLGVAATPSSRQEVDRLGRALGDSIGADEVVVANDALTGHLGALAGGWGVSLVVGSGIACTAVGPGPDATPLTLDGHGPLIGDRGSAYWIGRHAVRHVLDAEQLGGAPGAVAHHVVERLGPLDGLAYRLHGSGNGVAELAGLAAGVAALVGVDAVADHVFEGAAQHLATTCARAAAALGGVEPVPVALGGGVLGATGWLAGRVTDLLAAQPVPVDVRPAAGTPLDGAERLATAPRPADVHTWRREGAR